MVKSFYGYRQKMPKKKKKYKKLFEPVFGHEAFIYIGYTVKEAEKHFKKQVKTDASFELIEPASEPVASHYSLDNLCSIITFKDANPDPWVIAHEAVHVTSHIFKELTIEHKFDRADDEIFACIVGYLTREIINIAKGK